MQPLSRGRYVLYGIALVLIKFLIDAVVCKAYGRSWSPSIYWSLPSWGTHFALTLGLVSAPFAVLGLWLNLRRLSTLRLSGWLTLLFFIPAINLLFFTFLALTLDSPVDKSSLPESLQTP